MDYFKKLLGLLKIERQEDRASYQKLIENSSVSDRRANGIAWYPIAIRGSEMSRGDYLTVEVERTTHHEVIHQMRSGIPAVLFSNHDAKNDRTEGVISYVNANRLKITLRTDELPDWAQNGKLGIDLLFDDNSYDEMEGALKKAGELAQEPSKGKLIHILTGESEPTFRTSNQTFKSDALNLSQNVAVNRILSANELAVVHGPPGTGKTTTLVQAIKALSKTDGKPILVVAPSNAAVDLLSEKISQTGLNVLRVGNPARVSESLQELTMEQKMANHPAMKDIKSLKKRANEFKNMAHKYKRHFGKAEREQRKALFDEAHKIMKEIGKTEEYIIGDLMTKTQVVTATLVGANHYSVREFDYHTVIIDEAGQALEPACWIPILKAQKVVLAGDPYQLPPTIKSVEAAKGGLEFTLLEKCIIAHPESVVLLDQQYRMNNAIMGYSSRVFYQDKLKAHSSVATHVLFEGDQPLTFIDTAGCGFDEKLEGTSSTNPEEASFLFRFLCRVVTDMREYLGSQSALAAQFPSIGVISPYKQQIQLLKEQLNHITELKPYLAHISVNTIDSFQGQERDLVLISMTRSNTEGSIGFLSDLRRMNVAMTRARKKLVVIGDSGTLSVSDFYKGFVEYAEAAGGYHSAWEFME